MCAIKTAKTAAYAKGSSCVYIYTNGLSPEMLRQIEEGIKEEGVLSELFYSDGDADKLAAAARMPAPPDLNENLCENGAEIRSTAEKSAILAVYNGRGEDFKKLGANAARYIKNQPLRL